ncbi:MAG: sigma-54-dependent Fis family transcriptional regulator [Myxococcales bacterium]|nr:sigma-54-dependent Fis family transcriptional regulator [Myxococcales bacterium]
MKPRIWFPHPALSEASHYLRAAFRRAVATERWKDVWPLLTILYDLDDENDPPQDLSRLLREIAALDALGRIETWAEQRATPRTGMASYVVIPDAARLRDWLERRVREYREFDRVFTHDAATLLSLAKGADMALAIGHHRHQAAELPLPLLIYGPSGAGKEVLAAALHAISQRGRTEGASGFGPLNCGGLPSHLIESELFGHKKNSFTGAVSDRQGVIVKHANGTVFLDEIGDTPAEVQVRLLRFLNNGEVRPIGADSPVTVGPWVIAATHRNLEVLVAKGDFREDLYFRLRGDVIVLPPLAARAGDLFPVIERCIAKHARRSIIVEWTRAARAALEGYQWPANLREVDQLARALVLGQPFPRDILRVDLGDLPGPIRAGYLNTRKMAGQIVDLYHDTVTRYGTTAPKLRSELVSVFAATLRIGAIPGSMTAKLMEQLVGSPLFTAIAGDRVALDAHASAVYRHDQIIRTLAAELEQLLSQVDGVPVARLDVVARPPPEDNLPPWVQRLLGLMGDAALHENDLASKTAQLLAWVDSLSPGAQGALEAIVALIVHKTKEASLNEPDHSPPRNAPPGGRTKAPRESATHRWEQVRANPELFARYQRLHPTAVAMGGAFGVGERAVREAASKLGVHFSRGGPRPGSGRPRRSKSTGSRR